MSVTKNIKINGFVPKEGVLNVEHMEIDFSFKKPFDAIDNSLGAADIGKLDLPVSKVYIVGCVTTITTVEGGVATLEVGYTGSASYFHTGLNANAAATTVSAANAVEIDNTAADKFIIITANNAVDTAKGRILLSYVVIDR